MLSQKIIHIANTDFEYEYADPAISTIDYGSLRGPIYIEDNVIWSRGDH